MYMTRISHKTNYKFILWKGLLMPREASLPSNMVFLSRQPISIRSLTAQSPGTVSAELLHFQGALPHVLKAKHTLYPPMQLASNFSLLDNDKEHFRNMHPQGFIQGRAAPSLQFIKSQPLTQGFVEKDNRKTKALSMQPNMLEEYSITQIKFSFYTDSLHLSSSNRRTTKWHQGRSIFRHCQFCFQA